MVGEKYTKGEWKVVIYSSDSPFAWIESERGQPIARVNRLGMEANANLIASAPDLYEVLKAIKALPDFALPGKLYEQVLIAIAKAEGR